MKPMKLLNAGIVAATVAALAGCGGGSGGGGDAAIAAAPTTGVAGTASKGLVKNAKVLICRIVNGVPQADAACATTTTAADGSYSMTFADGFTGSVMVKVMPSTSGVPSTMVDDVTGLDIPYTMTMRAVVPAVSGTTTAYVTPFSEMAAAAASTGMMDPTRIAQSIAAVQAAMGSLGIDLSVMPMIDLQTSAADANALGMQSNMVKQLSRVALAAGNSPLLTDANGVPCNAAADRSAQIACAVAAMANVMTSYVVADPTRMATVMQALSAQNVTNVTIPVTRPNGTIGMQLTNMTDLSSMQAAMQNAGMSTNVAANTANAMMGKMH